MSFKNKAHTLGIWEEVDPNRPDDPADVLKPQQVLREEDAISHYKNVMKLSTEDKVSEEKQMQIFSSAIVNWKILQQEIYIKVELHRKLHEWIVATVDPSLI